MKAVEIKNLKISYGMEKEPALEGINLDIEEGEFVLLVGRTGSGKSTLLNAINGVIPHVIEANVEGTINVFGIDSQTTEMKDIAKMVGTVYQVPEDQIFALVVEDDIAFGPENMAVSPSEISSRVEWALKEVNLLNERRSPTFLLSGGQKQRLVIGGALAMRPKLLILDEPTSMLDSLGTEEVFGTLKRLRDEYGITIIMAEHKVERVLGLVDRLILISDKKITIDAPIREALMRNIESFGIEEPQIAALHKSINPTAKVAPINIDEFINMNLSIAREMQNKNLPFLDPDTMPLNDGENAVEFDDVWFKYERSNEFTLRGINFKIRNGESASIMGPNGSGKTTALRLVTGLQKATKGKVLINGKDASRLRMGDIAKIVGYVFQDPDQMILNTSVISEITFSPRLRGEDKSKVEKKAEELLRMFSLYSYKDETPHRLSVGQRRLLTICSVLINNPAILLLDEPTRGLDKRSGEEVLSYIKDLNKNFKITLIMVSHNVKQAADYSNKAIVFYDGKVAVEASPREAFSQAIVNKNWSVVPPQVFQLTYKLGIKPPAVKLEEAIALLEAINTIKKNDERKAAGE
ncbi:MAG: energy-coupling factor transporter ATPase [Conexivisphaerales archaeon]